MLGHGAGGVVVAQELHVAAQGNRRNLPARATAVGPAEQFRPEPDGKHLGMDAEATTHPIMAELVHEHEQRQHQDEVRQVGREQADDALHGSVHHEICFISIG